MRRAFRYAMRNERTPIQYLTALILAVNHKTRHLRTWLPYQRT